MENDTRRLHLGDLLTFTTGRLLSPDGMDGLYMAAEFLVGGAVFTHSLPRVCDEATPDLLRQFPFLSEIEPPEFVSPSEVDIWLADQVARYGTWFDVSPLPSGVHAPVDPLIELATLVRSEVAARLAAQGGES